MGYVLLELYHAYLPVFVVDFKGKRKLYGCDIIDYWDEGAKTASRQ